MNVRAVEYDLTDAAQSALQSTLLGELLENAQIGALAADELTVRYRAVRTTLAGLPITLGLFWRV
jgi:hypothetical protein